MDRRYGHNIFEILLYYMVNNRVIWSYIVGIRLFYGCNTVIDYVYMINNRVIWSYIRYIWLYIRYIWSYYKGNMVINEVYMVNI